MDSWYLVFYTKWTATSLATEACKLRCPFLKIIWYLTCNSLKEHKNSIQLKISSFILHLVSYTLSNYSKINGSLQSVILYESLFIYSKLLDCLACAREYIALLQTKMCVCKFVHTCMNWDRLLNNSSITAFLYCCTAWAW